MKAAILHLVLLLLVLFNCQCISTICIDVDIENKHGDLNVYNSGMANGKKLFQRRKRTSDTNGTDASRLGKFYTFKKSY